MRKDADGDGVRVDWSVTKAWVFPDEANDATDRLRESLIDESAFVPALWPIKTGNVLLVATSRQRITMSDWARIRADLEASPIEVDHVSTSRVWGAVLDLAETHRISVYDVMYLELALRMRPPPANLDRALEVAAHAAGTESPWTK